MAEQYYLTETDLVKLRELLRAEANRRDPLRIGRESNLSQSPDVFVARTSVGGIPAIDTYGADRPGSAECDIYRAIEDVDGGIRSMSLVQGESRVVYNLSGDAIPEYSWVLIARDKFGTWWVTDTLSDAAGITSINGDTTAAQVFAVGTAGTDFALAESGATHTFNLPDASANGWVGAGADKRGAVSIGNQIFQGDKGTEDEFYAKRFYSTYGVFATTFEADLDLADPWDYNELGSGFVVGPGLLFNSINDLDSHKTTRVTLIATQTADYAQMPGYTGGPLGPIVGQYFAMGDQNEIPAFKYGVGPYTGCTSQGFSPKFFYQNGYDGSNNVTYLEGFTGTASGVTWIGGHHCGGTLSATLADGDYGDWSVSGGVATIDNNAVTNAKLADMAAWTLKARNAGTSGDPQDVALADLAAETTPSSGDFFFMLLADGSFAKCDVDNLPGTDANAIHDNVAGEIAAITEKTTLVSADLLVIEDSEASNAKKRVTIANLTTAIGNFVEIAGDTMTGNLTIASAAPRYYWLDTGTANSGFAARIASTGVFSFDGANDNGTIDNRIYEIDRSTGGFTHYGSVAIRAPDNSPASYPGFFIYMSVSAGGFYTGFTCGAQAADINYTLPTAAPAVNGYLLSGTTAGVLSWVAPPGAGSDTTAIHDNVDGEIAAVTEKTTLVDADLLLIEDSEASNAKKRVTIANLLAPITEFTDELAQDAIGSILTDSDTVDFTYDDATPSISAKAQRKVNLQTGTTYTYVASDRGKLVSHTNASAIAATLPQAGTTGFEEGFFFDAQNRGVGILEITPTTSTIDGAPKVVLTTDNGVRIFSDGTNYYTQRGITYVPSASVTNAKLDTMAQATIKGRASGAGTGAPTDLSAAQVSTILGLGTVATHADSEYLHTTGNETKTGELTLKPATNENLTFRDNSGVLQARALNDAANAYVGMQFDASNIFFNSQSGGSVLFGTTSNPGSYPFLFHMAVDCNISFRSLSGVTQFLVLNDVSNAYAPLSIDGSSITLNYNSGGNVGVGTASFGGSAVGNLAFANGGTLGAATADLVSMTAIDNGAGNAEFQVRPEAGGILAYGSSNLRIGGPNGSFLQLKKLADELVTIAAAAFTDSSVTIPAGSQVVAVSSRVTIQPGTTTTFDIGIAGATTRYGTAISTAANTTDKGSADGLRYYAGATAVRITPDTTPSDSAGRIRIVIWGFDYTPPTS